ncbi:NUDIX domain-containing protein [Kocuria rhizophila]|uniref:NUDIX domain-containing protein n=1 Tax=Kocuria rhizophila TaxID=72000 RepID=UPI002882F329|nr:NUDIX domain-containing protein [Kocuria rhizophila]
MTGGTPRTRVVGAAILDAAASPTRVLAAQRAYPESLRGLWEFPGGKQEPGEGARDALLRECREELGVHLDLLSEVAPPEPDGWPLTGTAVMRVFTAVLGELSDVPPPLNGLGAHRMTPATPLQDAPPPADPTPTGPTAPGTSAHIPAPRHLAPPERVLEERVRTGEDHLDVRWLPLDDPAAVLALPWIPADLPIVAALLEMLGTERA